MRTAVCKRRGPIALIKKGSKQVVGVANVTDSIGPLTLQHLHGDINKHSVPASIFEKSDYNWLHAWQLSNISRLADPINYKHKNGAVIWVALNPEAQNALSGIQIDVIPKKILPNEEYVMSVKDGLISENIPNKPAFVLNDNSLAVPIARDRSISSPASCCRKGYYTVGEKGDEQKFSEFSSALAYLQKMPTAKCVGPISKVIGA